VDYEPENDSEVAVIAAEWGVSADLFDGVSYEIDHLESDDGHPYGMLVRFDDDTDEDTLIALGLQPGEYTRGLSLNAFDRPEPEDPYEQFDYLARKYKELGGAYSAIMIGDAAVLQAWYPSSEAAEQFWRQQIAPLGGQERDQFVRALARRS